MELILWRHADAENGAPDSARRLTAKGHAQARKVAAWLRDRLVEPRVLTSPAVRARETAAALTENFVIEPALDVGAHPARVLTAAGWPHDHGTVVVVGHQPTLGQVAALVMSGVPSEWSVKKGAIFWFSARNAHGAEPDHVVLRAALAPEMLD